MSELVGFISDHSVPHDLREIFSSNSLTTVHHNKESCHDTNIIFEVSYLKQAPVKGSRLFDSSRWVVAFAGDIIDFDTIPFPEIVKSLENKTFSYFKNFVGIYSIAAYDKNTKQSYLISDLLAQYPFFYYIKNRDLYFSSDLSFFCKLDLKTKFNKEWLWELMFFNFPVGYTTFLENIRRLPPFSILQVDHSTGKHSLVKYSDFIKPADKLIGGDEGLNLAAEIFSERIPKYFNGADKIACALTGGWDGRTLLALGPINKVTSYTYGIPGCSDLVEAKKTADFLGIKHKEILFNDEFLSKLPEYIYNTIFLSSGLQSINRSSLLYSYQKLTEFGNEYPITISGLALDILFRGYVNCPNMVSKDMSLLFTGAYDNGVIREKFWRNIFSSDFNSFKNHILKRLHELLERYGDFTLATHHLSYYIYEISAKYFCGEVKIANHYTTIRIPSLDSKIIKLANSIKNSTLTFSQFTDHKRGRKEEMLLQSYIFHKFAPKYEKIPIGNTRPDIILGSNTNYNLYKIYSGLKKRLKIRYLRNYSQPKLEDYFYWMHNKNRNFVDNLIFNDNNNISSYLEKNFLRKIKTNREIYYTGKIMTAEIILKLIKNNWKKFW